MAAMNPHLLLLEQVCRPLYGLEVSHVHNGDQRQSFYLNQQWTLERENPKRERTNSSFSITLYYRKPQSIPASSSPMGTW